MENRVLQRSIGLPQACFILVGYIVGASIFILPGILAQSTGPSVYISYLIAAIPALFTCFVTAQVGSAIPTSGASYVSVSRVISPFWGFMVIWTLIITMGVGVPLVAYGFSEYLSYFIPGINHKLIAISIIVFFVGVNILGVRVVSWIQAVMVVEFIAALLIFGIGGTANADPKLLTPLFPLGLGAVIMTAIPAYYSFTGFMVIAEIGEEIKNPSINIPRTLLISFFVVLIAYTLVPLAVTGVLAWDSLEDTQGAVAVASEIIFPEWLAKFIALSALFAIATSINGIIVAQSRDIFAVARDRVLPIVLTKVSKTFKAPYYAIIMIGALPLIGVAMGASIKNYAIMTVLGFMIFQILAGIVVLRLPKTLPERYEAAQFKLKGFSRPFFSVGLILISILFIVLGIKESPVPSLIYLILVTLGIFMYKLRKNYLQKRGFYLEEMLTKDLSRIL